MADKFNILNNLSFFLCARSESLATGRDPTGRTLLFFPGTRIVYNKPSHGSQSLQRNFQSARGRQGRQRAGEAAGAARRHAGDGRPPRRHAGRGRARPARQGADLGAGPHARPDRLRANGRADRAHRHLAGGPPPPVRGARVPADGRSRRRGPARHQRLGADEHGDAAAGAPRPAPARFQPPPRAHGGRRFRSPAAAGKGFKPGLLPRRCRRHRHQRPRQQHGLPGLGAARRPR